MTTLHDVHTCRSSLQSADSSAVSRAETSKLKFLIEAVPQLLQVDPDTPTRVIIEAVRAKYGQDIALRQAQKVKATLCPTPSKRSKALKSRQRNNRHLQSAQPQNNLSPPSDFDPVVDEDSNMDPNTRNGRMNELSPRLEADHEERGYATAYQEEHLAPSSQLPNLSTAQGANLASVIPPPLGAGETSYREPSRVYTPHSSRTPQEIRSEAAALFQRASEKFQEAAFLHAEATRLFVSVANS